MSHHWKITLAAGMVAVFGFVAAIMLDKYFLGMCVLLIAAFGYAAYMASEGDFSKNSDPWDHKRHPKGKSHP